MKNANKNSEHAQTQTIEDIIRVVNKMSLLGLTIFVLGMFDYGFGFYESSFDIIYREIYLVPVLMGAFFFGLRGALLSSVCVAVVYFPCAEMSSRKLDALYLSNYVQILLFVLIGILVGALRDRERIRKREKREAVLAMAGSVQHELNNPLANALLAAENLKEDIGSSSHHQEDMRIVIENLYRIKRMIRKISSLKEIKYMQYTSNTLMIDIN